MKYTLSFDNAKTITDKFFHPDHGTGHDVTGYTVSSWRPDIKDAFPLALIDCVEKWSEGGAPETYTDAGRQFCEAVAGRVPFGFSESQLERYGEWLDSNRSAIEAVWTPVGEQAAAPTEDEVDYKALYEQSQAEVEALRHGKADLENRVTLLNTRLSNATEYQRESVEFVEWLGKTLLDHAVDKDWCTEYERFLDDALAWKSGTVTGLHRMFYEAGQREREYEVEISEVIRGSVTVTRTITVTASSVEDAERVARDSDDGPDESDISEAVRYNGWDDWEAVDRDYEVQE